MDTQSLLPEIQAASHSATELQVAAATPIVSAAQYGDAAELLKRIKGAFKDVDAREHKITDPLMQTLKEVRDLFRGPKTILESAEGAIKAGLATYVHEQRRIAAEAQRKADEAAVHEIARLDALAKKAEARGEVERAEQFRTRADTVVAPVVVAEKPKVTGVSLRTSFDFEIVDAAMLPRAFLAPDEKRIRQVVRSLGKDANIPGVRVIERTDVAATSV